MKPAIECDALRKVIASVAKQVERRLEAGDIPPRDADYMRELLLVIDSAITEMEMVRIRK